MARSSGSDESYVDVVIVLGPPASGKTTLGRRLAALYDYVQFDVGSFLRDNMPPQTPDAEDFAMASVENALRGAKRVLLTGFPKYREGLRLLKDRCPWARLHLALVLEVMDDSVLQQRASARHLSGERPGDDDANFEQRLRTYKEETLLVVHELEQSCRVESLDASEPKHLVEKVAVEKWLSVMGQFRRLMALDGSARLRLDPDEADIEVAVCLLSGEERSRHLLPPRATVDTLRRALIADGEQDFDLTFVYDGVELASTDVIRNFGNGCSISMSRQKKPPPPPPPTRPPRARTRSVVCFSGDSLARVLGTDGAECPF